MKLKILASSEANDAICLTVRNRILFRDIIRKK